MLPMVVRGGFVNYTRMHFHLTQAMELCTGIQSSGVPLHCGAIKLTNVPESYAEFKSLPSTALLSRNFYWKALDITLENFLRDMTESALQGATAPLIL